MKKTIWLFSILLIGLINLAYAVDVGIVVEFADGTVKTDCVNVGENTDGYDILQKSNFNTLWSPVSSFGQLLCKIDSEGTDISGSFCEFFGDFWNFNILPIGDNAWIHSPVGHNGPGSCWDRKPFDFNLGSPFYCGLDKDVIGYKFGPGADEPPLLTFEKVCEKLNVKDIKVYVDGKKESGADEDGGKIDVIPGSSLELKIDIENLYDDEDVEIEEISITGTLEDIDGGDDIEVESKEFDLKADKDKDISLVFDIPLEVEEGDYDLVLEIEGENERGFPYFEEINFEVDVDKEKHDVRFEQLEFIESNFYCGQTASLKVKVINFGTADEEVKLAISSPNLGVNIEESFELSEDPFSKESSFSKIYKLILPADLGTGRYDIRADLIYGDNVEVSIVELNVLCAEDVSEEGAFVSNSAIKEKLSTKIAITEISISGGTDVKNVEIEVKSLKDKPVAKEAAPKVYQYLQITNKNNQNAQDNNAIIGFKVPKIWLNGNNLQSTDVSLYRYNGNEWNELISKVVNSDATSIYYEADIPGFSYFAIGSKTSETVQVQTQPTQTITNIVGATISVPVETKKPSNAGALIVSLIVGEVLLLIAGLTLLVHMLRK